jgi:HD-GYP domain-containing protein (c-di-GMP phosphodiesterase class II)
VVTVSIGVVTVLANDPQDQDTFISMADQATYQAKSEGRNCVVAFGQKRVNRDSKIDTIALLQETLRRILKKTKENSLASIQVLAQSVTGSHQDEHVTMATRYINLLCQGMGLPATIAETFTNGLTLYSCFRLLLYQELLAKKESFDFNDRKLINDLPYKMADLTQHFDYFSNERKMLLCQGERYDGRGHPEGLAGEEIPLTSRIFSIADALAAMNCDRPHRKRLSPSAILQELLRGAGTQWDPSLVLLILDLIDKQQLLPFDQGELSQTQLLISQKISCLQQNT